MNIIIATPERAEECWTVRNQAIRYGCKNSYSDTVIKAWTSDQMPDGFRNLITKDFFSSGWMRPVKLLQPLSWKRVQTHSKRSMFSLSTRVKGLGQYSSLHFLLKRKNQA